MPTDLPTSIDELHRRWEERDETWSVEDSTADFVAEFYRQFDVDTPLSGALRQAKLVYLEKKRPLGGRQAISLSHPLFWAPMTLTVSSGR